MNRASRSTSLAPTPAPAGPSPASGAGTAARPRASSHISNAGDDWDVVSTVGDASALEAATLGDPLAEWPDDKVAALQAALRAAPWHEVRHQIWTVYDVLSGMELVKWLITQNFATTVAAGTKIGSSMFSRRMIYPMRKTLRDKGFQASTELFYSLTVDRKEKNVFAPGDSGKPGDGKGGELMLQGVEYKTLDGESAEALVLERQRRSGGSAAPDGSWSAVKLLRTDPSAFSMPRHEVPVPAVGDATPDGCEWMGDWEEVIDEPRTDSNGWMYAVKFTDKATRGECHPTHCVRGRRWRRLARKTPLRQERVEPPAPTLTAEQIRQREMLERAAQVVQRQARMGVLKYAVTSARCLPKGESFVVVEVAGRRLRSRVAQRGQRHTWELEGEQRLDADSQPMLIKLFEPAVVGAPALIGQAEFVVPQNERSGAHYLPLHGGACDASTRDSDRRSSASSSSPAGMRRGSGVAPSLTETLYRDAAVQPAVRVEWCFTPEARTPGHTPARSPGQPPAMELTAERCILSLFVMGAEGLDMNIGRQSSGCCCFPTFTTSTKCQVVVHYRGEITDNVARSKPVPLRRSPQWDWKAAMAVNYRHPVTVEVMRVDKKQRRVCLGCLTLSFDNLPGVQRDVIRDLNPPPEFDAPPPAKEEAAAAPPPRTAADVNGPINGSMVLPDVEALPADLVLDEPLLGDDATPARGSRPPSAVPSPASAQQASARPSKRYFGRITLRYRFDLRTDDDAASTVVGP